MKMNKKLIQTIIFVLLFTAIPMSYNSCSSDHNQGTDEFASSLKACDLTNFYARTWYPFVQKQCAGCHYAGGEGGGPFADDSLSTAFRAFQLKGFSKVGKFAKDPGHKPPYTGLQNTMQVNSLMKRWADAEMEAKELCGSAAISNGRVDENFDLWLRFESKAMNLQEVGDSVYIEWDLDADMLPFVMPDEYTAMPGGGYTVNGGATVFMPGEGYTIASGAKLGISIMVNDNQGDVYYTIFDPILDMNGAVTDLNLLGLAFRINGTIIDNQTTFYKVNATRYKQDRFNSTPISSGAMTYLNTPRTTDVISLQIKDLKNLDLGPQPDGVKVVLAANDTVTSEDGTLTFTVSLTQPIDGTQVSVAIDNFADRQARGDSETMSIKNKDDEDIDVRLYDWDYKVLDNSVIFGFGQTVGTFRVFVRPDQRHEPGDESFRIELGFVNGPAEVDTARDRIRVTIDEGTSDPPPQPGEVTYSMLMDQSSGPFFMECIKCHNSTDGQLGGWDVTDYDNLIRDGIVIPQDYINSKMHIRLIGGTPTLPRMPINSSLNTTQINMIRKWIGDGGVATNPLDGSPIYPGSAKND